MTLRISSVWVAEPWDRLWPKDLVDTLLAVETVALQARKMNTHFELAIQCLRWSRDGKA